MWHMPLRSTCAPVGILNVAHGPVALAVLFSFGFLWVLSHPSQGGLCLCLLVTALALGDYAQVPLVFLALAVEPGAHM